MGGSFTVWAKVMFYTCLSFCSQEGVVLSRECHEVGGAMKGVP